MVFRFRMPKPLHGWKAFAHEIIVIVIGVLIALGFGQAAEWANWRGKVADGEVLLSIEALRNFGTSVEFYAAAPCMAAQVEAARRNLAAPGAARAPLQLYHDDFGSFVVRTPLRPLYEATWASLVNDGTLGHMGTQRFGSYSGFYETARKLSEVATAGDAQAQELLVLSQPIAPDAATLTQLSGKVELLGQTVAFGRVVAIRNIGAFHALGMKANAARVDAFLATSPTMLYCRRAGLPVSDWRKAANEKLSPISL